MAINLKNSRLFAPADLLMRSAAYAVGVLLIGAFIVLVVSHLTGCPI